MAAFLHRMTITSILAFVILLLGKPINCTNFQRYQISYTDWIAWNAKVHRILNSSMSLIECATFCSNDKQCFSFMFDQECRLGPTDFDWCETGSGVQDAVVYKTRERLQLVHGETEHPLMLSSTNQKKNWIGTQSMPYFQGSTLNAPHNMIDGDYTDSYYRSYHSHYTDAKSDCNHFPWVQIKFDSEYWVKGFQITSRRSTNAFIGYRHAYKEIRVGNTDIGQAPNDLVLCQNQLCYMTGEDQSDVVKKDCATPMKGKYFTIQKYAHYTNDGYDTIMEIIELDVEVHCGPFGSPEGEDTKICHVEEKPDACQRHLLANGKNEILVTTAGQKADWVLNASSVLESINNTDFTAVPAPEFAKDGFKTGRSSPTSIFHSGEADRYPWLQVDLATAKLIKAVHLYSRTDSAMGIQLAWVEVRVGQTDAGKVTPLGSRICVNPLCKTTGLIPEKAEQEIHTQDCASPPMPGRYVTIQYLPTDDVYDEQGLNLTDNPVGYQMAWTEVRIGNVDAGRVTPNESRFCVNSLCKTTGMIPNKYPNPHANTQECSAPPLLGRYVTIQMVASDDLHPQYPHLSIAEVDMIFYE